MNIMLFFLTVGSTIFTPVTFMSSAACLILIGGLTSHEVLPESGPIGHMRFSSSQVYGMNFENTAGTPTIPFLLEEEGYTYFWQLGQVMAARFFHVLFVICS